MEITLIEMNTNSKNCRFVRGNLNKPALIGDNIISVYSVDGHNTKTMKIVDFDVNTNMWIVSVNIIDIDHVYQIDIDNIYNIIDRENIVRKTEFLQYIKNLYEQKNFRTTEFEQFYRSLKSIGWHTKKQSTFFNTVSQTNLQIIQIFSGSPKSYRRPQLTTELSLDLHRSNQLITQINRKVFIHSSYIINLGKPLGPLQLDYIEAEFQIGTLLGSSGIVFHCGKHCGNIEAREIMKSNIIHILNEYVTEQCPFILETCAHQGTEMLYDVESFIQFCNEVSNCQKNKFKICVDTCHVWAANYEPITFIEKVFNACGSQSIILVHLNDSLFPKGARKDRHELPGKGHIGEIMMCGVISFCQVHKIPMVIEC